MSVSSRTHPLDTMLAVSDVLSTQRYATLYSRVLELGTPTVEEIATGLEQSTTTVYEDVAHLRTTGLLERVTDTQPHRYNAQSIDVRVDANDESYRVTPTLVVAIARAQTNRNLGLYRDRHGVAGLATAIEYTRDYIRGHTNARRMARELEMPVLEAETTLQELREIMLDVEPEIEREADLDALDAAVDNRR